MEHPNHESIVGANLELQKRTKWEEKSVLPPSRHPTKETRQYRLHRNATATKGRFLFVIAHQAVSARVRGHQRALETPPAANLAVPSRHYLLIKTKNEAPTSAKAIAVARAVKRKVRREVVVEARGDKQTRMICWRLISLAWWNVRDTNHKILSSVLQKQ